MTTDDLDGEYREYHRLQVRRLRSLGLTGCLRPGGPPVEYNTNFVATNARITMELVSAILMAVGVLMWALLGAWVVSLCLIGASAACIALMTINPGGKFTRWYYPTRGPE